MGDAAMMLDYGLIDADSHYYETYDCFSRHIEKSFENVAIHPVHPKDGIGRPHYGEKRLRFSPSWPTDLAGRPGALIDFYLKKAELASFTDGGIDAKQHPEMMHKAPRMALLDQENVQATIMLPTLAVAVEADLHRDVGALYANVRSFNRWVEEHWGYGQDQRVFGVPMISLVDPVQAAAEVKRLIAAGIKVIYMSPAPVYGKSPADPVFDPVWAQLNEARIPVIYHIGDCNAVFCEMYSTAWGDNPTPALHKMSAHQWYICNGERAIQDTLSALIFGHLFTRFPQLRIMTIELGADWVPAFLKNIDKAYRHAFSMKSSGQGLPASPSEIFRAHVWVTPFYEDDMETLVKTIGAEHVLFGSDWPHPEGVVHPIQFADRLGSLSEADLRKVMRDNTAGLLGLPV